MLAIFHAQHGRSWSPRVADVGADAEELVMVPVPVLRKGRVRQRETRKMKAHPGAARLHKLPERRALAGPLGPRVQKQDYLTVGEDLVVEVVPIGGGVVSEIVLR